MDFLIQNAYAQGAAQGSGFSPILIMVAFIALMYFMMIRPQQKRQKEHAALVTALKVGEEILTNGGILGIITGISDHYAIVKIAENTEIKIQKSSVASVTLVLVILLMGILFALPNIYGSAPAVQLANTADVAVTEAQLDGYVRTLEGDGITPERFFLKDDRAVIRFNDPQDQQRGADRLRARYGQDTNVALTLAPRVPDWVRDMGLSPMSLGLDLRGGVYVLLEVDMDTAIGNRMRGYEQSFDDALREEGIRHRADLNNGIITIRLTSPEDLELVRRMVTRSDPNLAIADGTDGKSLMVRMTELQIKERQDFAIEQNMTTLRNRVDQLGVAEPLVQRQGVDRIVVQLPGVQDPNELEKILTATATLALSSPRYSGAK